MLDEGTVLHVYPDQAGIQTVCTGHMMRPQDWAIVEDGVTPAECEAFLRGDLKSAEKVVNDEVKVALTQNQFDALVSFQFNTGGLTRSSVLRYLNLGNYELAADAFLLWNKRKIPHTETLVVDEGLCKRRARERALFLTPDDMQDEKVDDLLEKAEALQFDLSDLINWRPPREDEA